MSITSYLETLPLSKIVRYTGGAPKNGISFTGYPRQHPSDKNKIILVNDPLGENPKVMEFRFEDILGAEEVHSAVTKSGDTAPLVKVWVRKGSHGVLLEPFEVDDPIRFVNKPRNPAERALLEPAEK
ncbi:MAG: hypothetical protein LBG73_11435 [Spirochaetaceae bacterium]|jgi:hypothetical protein|nr:hypothetical protein [Spirochaetaceae bacterium]